MERVDHARPKCDDGRGEALVVALHSGIQRHRGSGVGGVNGGGGGDVERWE